MAQVYLIAGVIITIGVLICVVFIRQTIVKRHKEKMRLNRALDKRAKDLIQMLSAFPQNFLPRDLQVFLYRCIVDVFEQLSKLAPNEPDYLEKFQAYTMHMETAMRSPQEAKDISLQSSKQINEIRQYLNYLGRFLQKWMQRGNITQKQYSHYRGLLKNLITKIMVDNYLLSSKQAVQIEKPKLAVHYYTLARNLLAKEGVSASKKARLEFIDQELASLQKQIAKEEAAAGVAQISQEESSDDEDKQWKKFEEDADWKKKNIYD